LKTENVILDGELVALEAIGRPNFNELQNVARTTVLIHYIVFDVLHSKSNDLLDVALEGRKVILDELADHFEKALENVLVFPAKLDLETITNAHDECLRARALFAAQRIARPAGRLP
jgi:ATP-dependent DNA ligase